MRICYPTCEGERNAIAKRMNDTTIPDFVRRAERLLVQRGGKHFSGNKVDYTLAYSIHFL